MNTPQTIILHVEDSGDRSVGIWPLSEKVTIKLEYGGHSADVLKCLTDGLKELLEETLCECGGKAFTESEYAAMTKGQEPDED